MGHSVYYTVFIPSFKVFEVHLGQLVSSWQCLNVFISRGNETSTFKDSCGDWLVTCELNSFYLFLLYTSVHLESYWYCLTAFFIGWNRKNRIWICEHEIKCHFWQKYMLYVLCYSPEEITTFCFTRFLFGVNC